MRVGIPFARASKAQSDSKSVQFPVRKIRQSLVLPTGDALLVVGSFNPVIDVVQHPVVELPRRTDRIRFVPDDPIGE
jgi:hypothetical protein